MNKYSLLHCSLSHTLKAYIDELEGTEITILEDPRFDDDILVLNAMDIWKTAVTFQLQAGDKLETG